MGHIPKQAVLYMHHPEHTDYTCAQCMMFIDDKERCTIHPKDQVIRAHGSCGLWVGGDPATGKDPHGGVTAKQSGYVEHTPGFSCKRCLYWRRHTEDCFQVDKDSPGDDPGKIHGDACCNGWEAKRI